MLDGRLFRVGDETSAIWAKACPEAPVLTCRQVLLHGCVPVLLTHAFHPLAAKRVCPPLFPSLAPYCMSCIRPRPFETLIDWRRIAVFLHNSQALLAPSESGASMPALALEQVADAPAILRNISEEELNLMNSLSTCGKPVFREEYLSMHRQVTRVQRLLSLGSAEHD